MVCFPIINSLEWLPQVIIKKFHASLCFLAFLLTGTILPAQKSLPLRFESLTINNGLSQGFVSDVIQDSKGLMWFTTSDGLNQYDGYSFTIYHHDAEDRSSLGSDDLSCIFEDSKGRLWVGTRHNGLDLFVRERNVFYHIRHAATNSLRSNNILKITEDKTGNLWIRTDEGIDRLDLTDTRSPGLAENNTGMLPGYAIRFMHIQLDSAYASVMYRYEAPKVFVNSRNHVYITTNSGIWEAVYTAKQDNYKVVQRYRYHVIDSFQIANLIEDTVNHCLYMNNRNIIKFTAYNFDSAVTVGRNLPPQVPWVIDTRRRLWVPGYNNIFQISMQSDRIDTIMLADPSGKKFVISSIVLYTDRTGMVWIATGGYGILKYNPEKENFHHIFPGYVTYQLFESSSGQLVANGLRAISIKKNQPSSFTQLIDPAILRKNGLHIQMGSFTQDNKDNYWFGMHSRIIQYNIRSKKIRKVTMPVTDKASLPFPLYADKKQNLWMGYNRYFIRYDLSSGLFTKYEYPGNVISYDYDFLQCIYEEGDRLWLGSVNGLFCFDTLGRFLKHYIYRQTDSRSLSSNFVLSLYNDRQQPGKYLWVGTKGGGLNRLEKDTDRFTRYNVKNGLPNNVVYGILPDATGNLWLSTNKGLSEFNVALSKFRNFDVRDGLQSNEFNRYAYCRISGGLMVFGGMNGINYFDPAEIKQLEPPDVIFTDFRLFNKSVNFEHPGSPIEKKISFTDKVVLQYHENVVTFQFAAMDYRKEGNALYRYTMKGFDKDWIYAGTVREATYTNLDPGTYRFMVQGSFEEGSWGARPLSVMVIVIPPWWRTWWFYAITLSGSISILYALYRYRLNQLLALERVRNRIARDLHDEVGSSISTIAIYSKIIREHLGSASFNNEPLLSRITENAFEIMESMNDIVWNINTKNDAFEHIINRMREHAYQLFEAKGYTLHFNFNDNLIRLKMGMEKRKDFYLIYKEALNNIAKYASGKNVWITLVANNAAINLTIRDDGKGFDMKTVRKNSNGLTNMHYRTAALKGKISIISTPGKGTEIHLSFS